MSQPATSKPHPGRKKKPLIYLVDDQPLLLDLAELALKDGGYTFKKFNNPVVALEAFAAASAKPDLVISDFAMGRMSGLELIERCKQSCPALKSIVLSGTAGADVILGAPAKVDRFIGKPYQAASLAEMVRGLLDA
jgi:CheY-like chemotaxis protein